MIGKKMENGIDKVEDKTDEKKSYLLRDIPANTWDAFALKGKQDGLNIKELLYLLVFQYASGDIELKRSV